MKNTIKKRIPKTNNMGGARKKLTPDNIAKRTDFSFRGKFIKKFMSEEAYQKFCVDYTNNRTLRSYQPASSDIRAFELYRKGEVTLDILAEKLNAKNTTKLYYKMGRLYAYATTK